MVCLQRASQCALRVASPTIDTVVVKLRDDAEFNAAAGLSAGARARLDAALRTPFTHAGYTRDGALQLQLVQPLTLDAARAAINRARLLPEVLYANVVPPASAAAVADAAAAGQAAARQRSVDRLIVKFRDAVRSSAASRNEGLVATDLDDLSALAGQPVANERAMSGGAYVVRLFQALPLDQARALARHLAASSDIEYVEPDLLKQPLRVPNDPLYTSQWHYLSPPAEMGGVNLPPAWDITTGAAGIRVAVIDTGSLPVHPDLVARISSADSSAATTSLAIHGSPTTATAAIPILPIRATGSPQPRAADSTGFFCGLLGAATARSTARTSPERSAPRPTTASASRASTG